MDMTSGKVPLGACPPHNSKGSYDYNTIIIRLIADLKCKIPLGARRTFQISYYNIIIVL